MTVSLKPCLFFNTRQLLLDEKEGLLGDIAFLQVGLIESTLLEKLWFSFDPSSVWQLHLVYLIKFYQIQVCFET